MDRKVSSSFCLGQLSIRRGKAERSGMCHRHPLCKHTQLIATQEEDCLFAQDVLFVKIRRELGPYERLMIA